jgi:hypothetical protein
MDFSLPETAHPLEQILIDCKTALRYRYSCLLRGKALCRLCFCVTHMEELGDHDKVVVAELKHKSAVNCAWRRETRGICRKLLSVSLYLNFNL